MKVKLSASARAASRFDIALLSKAAMLDADDVFLRANKKSMKLLKEFSDSLYTEPLTYTGKTFVGIPLVVDKSVEDRVFILEPSGDRLEV